MKILWLDLNSSYAHSSLALPAIHAQLPSPDQYVWERVSATINDDAGIVTEKIYKHCPDIIAASNWLFNHDMLLCILARVKALLPQCCIILGGPEFLGENEFFLKCNPFVDCIIRGEGEESLPMWLNCYKEKERWVKIPGLCYIDSEGYHDNGKAIVSDFQKLTPPEESKWFNWEKPFVQLETTRGCFNTCAFCVSGGEKPVRQLPIELIEKRLEIIHKHYIHDVRLLDRTFNFNEEHALALLNLFEKYKGEIRFHLEVHPALLSEKLKAKLATLPQGLLHIEAGVQSLHDDVLDTTRRKGGLEKSIEGLEFLFAQHNLITHVDLIAGLPGYSLNQIFNDVKWLSDHGAIEIQLETLKLLPGTTMREKAAEWGITYSPFPPYEVLQTQQINPAELIKARRLSRLLDFYYNTSAWRSITQLLIKLHNDFLQVFLNFFEDKELIDQPLSLEHRGLLLYDFCEQYYPNQKDNASMAWIEAGMSLKKHPAESVCTKHAKPPKQWRIIGGTYNEHLTLCYLPLSNGTEIMWYAFNPQSQLGKPVFKAISTV